MRKWPNMDVYIILALDDELDFWYVDSAWTLLTNAEESAVKLDQHYDVVSRIVKVVLNDYGKNNKGICRDVQVCKSL